MTLYKRALFKRIKDKYAPDEVDKLALLIILAFLTIFSVMGCIEAYASSEVFAISRNNWGLQSYHIVENPNRNCYQYLVTPGNEYTITASGSTPQIVYRNTNGDVLNLGDEVSLLLNFSNLESVSFVCPDDVECIAIFVDLDNELHLYNNAPTGYETSVSTLVSDVGTGQIWDVFESGISFVVVVVAVAFGIFLIVLAIRKVSKGKSEF